MKKMFMEGCTDEQRYPTGLYCSTAKNKLKQSFTVQQISLSNYTILNSSTDLNNMINQF